MAQRSSILVTNAALDDIGCAAGVAGILLASTSIGIRSANCDRQTPARQLDETGAVIVSW
jgi:hypothetical protein